MRHNRDNLVVIIQSIEYHRNGVDGKPFHVILFTDEDQSSMVATVFEAPGTVSVLDVGLLTAGEIRFGYNSYRGDDYEPILRAAIAAKDEADRFEQFLGSENPSEDELPGPDRALFTPGTPVRLKFADGHTEGGFTVMSDDGSDPIKVQSDIRGTQIFVYSRNVLLA